MSKIVEKHVTLDEPTYDLLKRVAEKEHRTMRGTLHMLIEAHAKTVKVK